MTRVNPPPPGLEQQRLLHGWFGRPWPSGVCYDETGRELTELRKPFPAGESCRYCGTAFDEAAGHSGVAIPDVNAAGALTIRHVHKECVMVQVLGPLAHHERRCPCYGGPGHATAGITAWEEALEVWRRLTGGQP